MSAKRIKLLASALVTCALVAAIGGSAALGTSGSNTNAAHAAASPCIHAPKKTMALIDIAKSSPMDQKIDAITNAAARALGWKIIYTDTNADPAKAQAAMTSAINQKVDLIVNLSIDQAGVRQGLIAAKAAHIPVFLVGGGANPTNLYTAVYTQNERQLGATLGRGVLASVPNAQVADLYTTFDYAGVARNQGFVNAIKRGKAKIVASHNVNIVQLAVDTAKSLTDMLTAHPNINVTHAVFDNMAVPAASAIRTQNSKSKLFTYFGTAPNIANIASGRITGLGDANLALTPLVAMDQYLRGVKTGAKYDRNAIQKAGGLGYRFISSGRTKPYSNDKTLAPFLAKWQKMYPC